MNVPAGDFNYASGRGLGDTSVEVLDERTGCDSFLCFAGRRKQE